MTRAFLLTLAALLPLLLGSPPAWAQDGDGKESGLLGEREREAMDLIRRADKLIQAGRHAEALPILELLQRDFSDTKAYADYKDRVDEALAKAKAEASDVKRICQAEVDVLGADRAKLTYKFGHGLELGDFEIKGRPEVGEGRVTLKSGATLRHKLRFPGDLRVVVESEKKSRIEIQFAPDDGKAKGYTLRIDNGKDVALLRGGTPAGSSAHEADKPVSVTRTGGAWSVSIGTSEAFRFVDAEPLPVTRVEVASKGTTVLTGLVLEGAYSLAGAPDGKFLPEGFPVSLVGGTNGKAWRLTGQWDLTGDEMRATKAGATARLEAAGDLEGRSYLFEFDVLADFERAPRQRKDGPVFTLSIPANGNEGAWVFRTLRSVMGAETSAGGRERHWVTLTPGQWSRIRVKVHKQQAEGYLDGKKIWSLPVEDLRVIGPAASGEKKGDGATGVLGLIATGDSVQFKNVSLVVE